MGPTARFQRTQSLPEFFTYLHFTSVGKTVGRLKELELHDLNPDSTFNSRGSHDGVARNSESINRPGG